MKRFLLVLFTLTLFLPAFAGAQVPTGPWYDQTPDQFGLKVKGIDPPSSPDEIFGERYTFAQVNWILNSLANVFSFGSGFTTKDALLQWLDVLIQKIKTGALPAPSDLAQFGMPGFLAGSIVQIYTLPPASGIYSINQTLAKFDIAAPANAQGGFGYTSLTPVSVLWQASRNMAYVLMVVLLVASGFMIMFRVKINPQTAVTLQLMIPKIIITLLLVTFSYAISGLVIDLVYVVISFVIAIFATTIGGVQIVNSAPLAINFLTGGFSSLVIYFILPWIILALAGVLIAGLAGGISGLLTLSLGTAWDVTRIGATWLTVVQIIFIVFLGWLLVKIWWMLLKTYLTFIFLIILRGEVNAIKTQLEFSCFMH